jgi:primosomal protein N' (replication factor Y)
MKYAEVAVNASGGHSTYCYSIPARLNITVGQAVWVPFGTRTIQGIVSQLSDQPSVEATKEIADVITSGPLLSPIQIELAQWISDHYFCPLFDATALMLPPGFERKLVTCFRLAEPQADLSCLTPEQRQVMHLIRGKVKASLRDVEKAVGIKKAKQISNNLLHRRLIIKDQELEKAKIRPKTLTYLELTGGKDGVTTEIALLKQARAYKQAELLEFLSQQRKPISTNEVRRQLNCSLNTIKALQRRNLLSIKLLTVRRDPLSRLDLTPSWPPAFTPSQEAAWRSIADGWSESRVFLLFGVTGSGKTEIYLRALARVIAEGKRGICLVPEIALTPQTVERFANRFPGRVALFHSGLSLGEQFDEWQWIREGNCDVVIGPRGALFAPQRDVGLIIIDEEHEWTYKQEDKSPRYHARDVATKLAELVNAVVILGSATPDVDSFYKAQLSKYQLVELKERIAPHGYLPLPEVNIVDEKEELKAGNTSVFSRPLLAAMEESLARHEQVILFLNRRGTATFVRCGNCGFVFRCPRCSVALTYHSVEKRLTCHRCHYVVTGFQICPQCFSTGLRFLGIGTQKVEEETKRLFPQARVLRWDRDVITKRYSHEEVLSSFRDHKADILIGTQMIAKGLDLPRVTLAGVISADTGLNLPDFRAGERTFQLLCQVAGRAGRGVRAGKVIIQTYSPENYAVQAAANHDYVGFFNQEIDYRRQYSYPPFACLVRLVYAHTNNELCRREAERMSHIILDKKESEDLADLSLIGPVPAFAFRLRGRYRWQIILRGDAPAQALSGISLPRGWTVDVDPVGIV